MGHIRKQGENSWQVIVSKGKNPVTGEYERIYETVKGNKTKAKERMHELEHKVATGSYVEPSEITLEKMLKKWYEEYAEVELADSTAEIYKIIINAHIMDLLGHIKLDDLQAQHIQSYISKKLKEGKKDGSGELSKASVRKHYIIINSALKYAVRMQIIDNNPANPVRPPVRDDAKVEPLAEEKLKQVLDAAEGWLYDFVYISAKTGLRRGELLGLSWENVDIENNKIQVRQSAIMLEGGNLTMKEPKTKESKRQVDISESVCNILKDRKLQQKKNKLRFAEKYNNEYDLVFVKEDGRAYYPDYATKSFKKLVRKLDLGQYKLHDLRHTHATLMLKAGVHPKVVQERLGHSSISQTLDTCSHVIPSMQEEAVKKFDEITSF